MICSVYRSRRKADVYLFVDHEDGFSRVPQSLLDELGGTEKAMTLVLKPGRRLARADAVDVMRAIRENGYYLQLPPLGQPSDPTTGERTC